MLEVILDIIFFLVSLFIDFLPLLLAVGISILIVIVFTIIVEEIQDVRFHNGNKLRVLIFIIVEIVAIIIDAILFSIYM